MELFFKEFSNIRDLLVGPLSVLTDKESSRPSGPQIPLSL